MTKQAYKIDWLAFTIPADESDYFGDLQEFLDFCSYNINEFESIEGRNFYNSGFSLSDYVLIYYNNPAKDKIAGSSNTVNIVFTGQGCTDLYLRLDGDWIGLFRLLRRIDARMTRLDLAMDDYEGVLNLKTIAYKLDRGQYRSKKKSFNVIQSVGKNENAKGQTVYIGNPRAKTSRDGNVVYRLYDKRMQYIEERQLLPAIAEECWLRYELMLTRNKAEKAIDEFLRGRTEDQVYKGIVRNLVTFLNPTKGKNGKIAKDLKTWETSSWWADFVEENEEIVFNNAERDADLYTVLMWLRQSVVPTLKNVERIFDYHGVDLYEVLRKEIVLEGYPKKAERLYNNLCRPEEIDFVTAEKERFVKGAYKIM